jgi:hypothetical protein
MQHITQSECNKPESAAASRYKAAVRNGPEGYGLDCIIHVCAAYILPISSGTGGAFFKLTYNALMSVIILIMV